MPTISRIKLESIFQHFAGDFCGCHTSTHGEISSGNSFGETKDIRLYSKMFAGEKLSRSSKTAGYFIYHQQCSIAGAQSTYPFHKRMLRYHYTQIADDRLHYQCSNVSIF